MLTPEEKVKLDAFFAERTKHEEQFLKENGGETNEYGVHIYVSSKGNHSLNLAMYLRSYRDWLIDNDIVKEKI